MRAIRSHLALAMLGTLLALTACGHSIAGFYLANLPDGVAMFEIDTGAGNTIAGRLQIAVANAAGTLILRDTPISGTITANQIDITIGQPTPFAAPEHLSGHQLGKALVLDGTDPFGHTLHLLARHCTESAAEAALTTVKTRAATSRAATERIAQDQMVQQITLAASDYTDAADTTAARIAQVAAMATSLTTRMRAAAVTPRSGALLNLAQQSAIIYSQFRIALFQAASTAASLQRRLAMANTICATTQSGGKPGTLKADCMALASVTPGFEGAVATVARAFGAAQLAWQQAARDQAVILQQAREK